MTLERGLLSSIPFINDDSNGYIQDMAVMRDAFYDKIPPFSKTEQVKTLWQDLWQKAVLSLNPVELQNMGEAFVFAAKAHGTQKRKTGEPYMIHPLNVALNTAGLMLDVATIEASLLHDVLEDTDVTPEMMREKFGADVERLVDGVTKLAVKEFMSREDLTAENLRHMFIVMAKDIRVVMIKLADRLHNMRTLNIMKPDKQQRIARETMEIYAPLAHRLGIYQIKRELEDLSFMYLHNDIYQEVKQRVKERMPQMEQVIDKAKSTLEERLRKENIPCRIKGRAKHIYSIYEKMQRKKISFDELYDILAVRVLVSDVSACYAVLGVVHALWLPVPGQFDDYIANPKSNMYQSLHTTVIVDGVPLEVQIRTYEMNNFAEYGVAAHWVYKEGGNKKLLKGLNEKLMLIRQVMEAGQEGEDTKDFVDILKTDILLTSELYVFTPDGKPMILPKGSTVLDFAYAVHTEIGNHCAGAMINGRIVQLNTQLHSGDRVKILTSPQTSPSKDWLKIVSSAKTRSKIRRYFKDTEKADRDEKTERGWKLIERELKRRGLENVNRSDFTGIDEELLKVGTGTVSAGEVAQKLSLTYVQQNTTAKHIETVDYVKEETKKTGASDILVEGENGLSVTLANCCSPVPGDDIIGYSSMRRGITIHRRDCLHVKNASPERKISVSWSNPEYSPTGGKRPNTYTAKLKVEGEDRENLIADTIKAIENEHSSITAMKTTMRDNSTVKMKIEIRVADLKHLYSVISRINEVRGILHTERE